MKRILLLLTLSAFLAAPAASLAATAATAQEQGTAGSLKVTVTKSQLVGGSFKLVRSVATIAATLPTDTNNLQVTINDNGDGTGHINGIATFGGGADGAVLFDGDVLVPDPGLVFTGQVTATVAVVLPSGETISPASSSNTGAATVRAVMKRDPVSGAILTGLVTLKLATANMVTDATSPASPVMLTITFPNTKLSPVPVP